MCCWQRTGQLVGINAQALQVDEQTDGGGDRATDQVVCDVEYTQRGRNRALFKRREGATKAEPREAQCDEVRVARTEVTTERLHIEIGFDGSIVLLASQAAVMLEERLEGSAFRKRD